MIVITGGTGFIGSVLAHQLNKEFPELLIVDQQFKGTPQEANLTGVRYSEYVDSKEFLERLHDARWSKRIRAIFHQGACSSTTEMNVEYLRRNNTEYSQKLATWSLENDVYFSYASSAATYGNGELGYSDDDQLTFQLKPLNPYGQSKLDFDQWLITNKLQNRVAGFRYFNVYGPNEAHKGDMRSMVHKGFEQVRDTGKLKLFKSHRPDYPDGGQKRDFIYVKDVADAVLWFFKNKDKKGIFNLGTGKAQTWNDLAHALFAAMNKPVKIEYIPMPDSIRNQYQYFTQADLTKLRVAGCPTAFRDLNAGVADYLKHLTR